MCYDRKKGVKYISESKQTETEEKINIADPE